MSDAGYLIAITNPDTGRSYLHGEEFAEQPGDGNNPTYWPSWGMAEWTAEACRSIGRIAQVIPAELRYAEGAD